jgi:hypothetical protein
MVSFFKWTAIFILQAPSVFNVYYLTNKNATPFANEKNDKDKKEKDNLKEDLEIQLI